MLLALLVEVVQELLVRLLFVVLVGFVLVEVDVVVVLVFVDRRSRQREMVLPHNIKLCL